MKNNEKKKEKKKKKSTREHWLVRLDICTGHGSLVQNKRKWPPPSCVSTREGSAGEGVLALCHLVSWAVALALALSVGVGVASSVGAGVTCVRGGVLFIVVGS
jgi:hypothetical protein